MLMCKMQEYGCAALWNLAANEDNKVTIAEAGGITTIQSAMKTYYFNANVQYYGCAALGTLAVNNLSNKEVIAHADVKVAIDSALRNHSANAGVKAKAERALQILNHEN